ncbi:MAG: alpha/beta hydrolase [Victivallaceae bacterium]|nr:alpha/beta hydrolase [Victivallaceae bacterium]
MKKTYICILLLSTVLPLMAGIVVRDISYYEDESLIDNDRAYAMERCKLDVFVPEKVRKGTPVVLFFHGGGLTGGNKSIPEDLRNTGVVVVAANYRFSSNRAKCPDYLYDAAAAASWVFRHIAEYGGDPDAVAVTGHSAGGYLAAMIGMDKRYLAKFGFDNLKFMMVAPVSGQMSTHFQIQNERLGTKLPIARHLVIDEYAPLWHAGEKLPKIVLFTGDENLDWPGRPQENLLLHAMLRNARKDARAECFCFAGFDHGTCVAPAMIVLGRQKVWEAYAERKRPLLMPPPYDTESGGRLSLKTKFGNAPDVPTSAVIDRKGGKVVFNISCVEPEFGRLKYKEQCCNSDCVHIYVGDGNGRCGQFTLDSSGRTEYYGFGLKKEAYAATATRTADGWNARVEIPESVCDGNFLANIVRVRRTLDSEETSYWSPVFGSHHLEPEAFVKIK